jgi:hypothetical protein
MVGLLILLVAGVRFTETEHLLAVDGVDPFIDAQGTSLRRQQVTTQS